MIMAAKAWKCTDCRHIVIADEMPSFAWDDGHVCTFKEYKRYFNFDDLVQPPSTDSVIFYRGKGDDDD